jgi:hypothetical protein
MELTLHVFKERIMSMIQKTKRKEMPDDGSNLDAQHRREIAQFLDDPGNPDHHSVRDQLARCLDTKVNSALVTQD